jgi:glutamyl-tRNA reductase
LARQRLGNLDQSTVLLIGTGDLAELTAKQLAKRGVKQLLVLGRAPSRAERLALAYGGRAITPGGLAEALARSDVVISATGARQPILHREQVRSALAHRSGDRLSLLLIDLSVPRNIDPTATELPGVEVHTIDDLRGTIERALMRRRAELPSAYAILGSEVARFTAWLNRREAKAAAFVS